jgi:hypothetical protein
MSVKLHLNRKAQNEGAKGTVYIEEEQNRMRVDKFYGERIYDFFLHLRYDEGDQCKKNEMARTCSAGGRGKMRGWLQNLKQS